MDTKFDRDELLAYLMQSYEMELAALTDAELKEHFEISRQVSQMSDMEWAELKNRMKPKQK